MSEVLPSLVGSIETKGWLASQSPDTSGLKIALYPGTFDPPTFGHLNLIARASKLFDVLIVLVAINPDKKPFIPIEDRVKLLKEITEQFPNVHVDTFDKLTVDYAKANGVITFVRGMRPAGDFEPEYILAMSNADLEPDIETCWLATSMMYSHVSSSLVRQVYRLSGDNRWTKWVPNPVIQYMSEHNL